MWIGFFYGVFACVIWGFVYLIPLVLPGYDAGFIASGRFVVYGLVSVPLIWWERREIAQYTRSDWWRVAQLGIVGNIVYYWFLAECVKNAGAPLGGMCMAVIPVLTTIFGNLQERRRGKALPWKGLIVSIVMILVGIVMSNWTEFDYVVHVLKSTSDRFWFGAAMGVVGLLIWTWYALVNSDWLRQHPERSPRTWSTAQGLTAFPFAVVLYGFVWQSAPAGTPLLGSDPMWFLFLMFFAGFFCSWLAIVLWNEMSQRLPTSIAGQMIVFESIFAVLYAHALRWEMPKVNMIVGMVLLIGGVLYAMHVVRRGEAA